MTETTGDKQPKRGGGRPFEAGKSGNPAGRPAGSRHAALKALDAIGDQAAADIMKQVVEQAKAGDMRAAEILLRRLWPERKGRAITFDLPRIETAGDLPAALGSVLQATATGELTPDEAAQIAALLEAKRKALETLEMEQRIAALEQRTKEQGR